MKIKYLIRFTWNIEREGQNSSQDFLTDPKNDYKVFKFDTKEKALSHIEGYCSHFKNKLFEIVQIHLNE